MEHQQLWEQLSKPATLGGTKVPAMGPVPWYDPTKYLVWGNRPSVLVCPSDADAERFPVAASYTINYGDAVNNVGAPIDGLPPSYAADRGSKRGAFMRQQQLAFRDFLDGLSNTLLWSEARIGGSKVAKGVTGLGIDPSLCISVRDQSDCQYWPEGRKACWADGSLRSIGFQTILPPNSPSATSSKGELEGVMSASSLHPGGVHVLFADGSVKFVSNSIDAGDPSAASISDDVAAGFERPNSQSPYGLWGALGTRAARELIKRPNPNISQPLPELNKAEIDEIRNSPVQTWRLSDGDRTIRAWQVQVVWETHLVLLTEDGVFKSVRLSELHSEDAYRAVQETIQQQAKMRLEVVEVLERGLRLLEQRKYQEFADQIVADNLSPRVKSLLANSIETQRGKFIYRIDSWLRSMRSENVADPFVTISGGVAPGPGLIMKRFDREWRIDMSR
jgi:prepilin-type processing-associated H-X9-DG protein